MRAPRLPIFTRLPLRVTFFETMRSGLWTPTMRTKTTRRLRLHERRALESEAALFFWPSCLTCGDWPEPAACAVPFADAVSPAPRTGTVSASGALGSTLTVTEPGRLLAL